MPNDTSSRFRIGDFLIQYGCSAKDEAETRIEFAEWFDDRPTVVVSSLWEGAGGNVGAAETIHETQPDSFSLHSGNAGSNYGVTWIAVGTPNDTRMPADPLIESDALRMQFGRYEKVRNPFHGVAFHTPFAAPPNLVIAPHWDGVDSAVGHAETIMEVRTEDFLINSHNAHPDYSVHWIATLDADEGTSTGLFRIEDRLIQTGLTRKTSAQQNVSFFRGFGSPPVVVVSPVWRDGVGHAETLRSVSAEGFELISGNAADDYDVSWLAIGSA